MLRQERIWQLSDSALAWSEGRAKGHLYFADIESITIQALPQLGAKDLRQCAVKGRGQPPLMITSTYAKSWIASENRSEAYAAFVRALATKAAAANPAISFRAGSTIIWWAWTAFLVLAAIFVAMFMALLASGVPITTTSAGPMVVMCLMLPGAVRGMKYRRRRPFDPSVPPAQFLSA